MAKIKITEVGPRDGLQNESQIISLKNKISLIQQLDKAGLNQIEIGAFVSPKWVPQMKNTLEITNYLVKSKSSKKKYSVLVPNIKGMEQALNTKISKVAIFGSCTEAFSQKNINCSVKKSFNRFSEVIQLAKKNKVKVRGYLSTVFGCPYEGRTSVKKAVSLTKKMLNLGVYEVSIGDTIGVASPKQVRAFLELAIKEGIPLNKMAMHFHDTRGTALANVLASLDLGVKSFDSSVGGLGGCPYADGALGNLATEDLIYMLHEMGHTTGVDLKKIISTKKWIEKVMKKPLPSHVGQSGLPW